MYKLCSLFLAPLLLYFSLNQLKKEFPARKSSWGSLFVSTLYHISPERTSFAQLHLLSHEQQAQTFLAAVLAWLWYQLFDRVSFHRDAYCIVALFAHIFDRLNQISWFGVLSLVRILCGTAFIKYTPWMLKGRLLSKWKIYHRFRIFRRAEGNNSKFPKLQEKPAEPFHNVFDSLFVAAYPTYFIKPVYSIFTHFYKPNLFAEIISHGSFSILKEIQ